MNNEKKDFSCVLCGSKLSSKEALQEHFRKHANKEIDAKGNPLPKQVEKTENMEDNKTSDSKETINCDVCPMKFETVTQAIQHKFRKHPESSLKYYCPFCGMQFPLKYTKDKHVQSHSGMSTAGSFPCPECGVIFHNVGAQTYHVKSTHKRILSIFKPIPTPPPSKKIRINNANEAQSVYYCHLCGSEYIIKFNLQKHLERAHTEEERNTIPPDLIKCTTCDALFYNKRAYETHNMYHKPDDLYVTSEEQRLQTVTRVDQDFDIRRVQLTTEKFIPIDRPKQRRPVVKKYEQKNTKVKNGLNVSDEELSPNSSIDSSDSDMDLESRRKAQEKKQEQKRKLQEKEKLIQEKNKDTEETTKKPENKKPKINVKTNTTKTRNRSKNKKESISESSVETSDEEKKCIESQQNKKLPKRTTLLKKSTKVTEKRKKVSTNKIIKKQKI